MPHNGIISGIDGEENCWAEKNNVVSHSGSSMALSTRNDFLNLTIVDSHTGSSLVKDCME
jgi:hypothetical protein